MTIGNNKHGDSSLTVGMTNPVGLESGGKGMGAQRPFPSPHLKKMMWKSFRA
jgi:hypothetical protein